MKKEVWKQIDGFEDYLVSNLGHVRSQKCGRSMILKPSKNHKGYYHVGLCKNGQHHTKRIHKLVALNFIPNPLNMPEINHKNGVKTDNRI